MCVFVLSQGDLDELVKQVRMQLKKIAITDRSRVDEMFLRYDTDRTGYMDVENMRDLCRRLQLPVDDDVMLAVSEWSVDLSRPTTDGVGSNALKWPHRL